MRTWMKGNQPVAVGAVPALQITGWGAPLTTLLRNTFRGQSMLNQNGVRGLGLLDSHPRYNDIAYWRSGYVVQTLALTGLGAFMGAYHGRKRSGGKLGSTLGYGLAGALVPIPTLAVSAFQGFGKRKRR